jgi:hypothetical protein
MQLAALPALLAACLVRPPIPSVLNPAPQAAAPAVSITWHIHLTVMCACPSAFHPLNIDTYVSTHVLHHHLPPPPAPCPPPPLFQPLPPAGRLVQLGDHPLHQCLHRVAAHECSIPIPQENAARGWATGPCSVPVLPEAGRLCVCYCTGAAGHLHVPQCSKTMLRTTVQISQCTWACT